MHHPITSTERDIVFSCEVSLSERHKLRGDECEGPAAHSGVDESPSRATIHGFSGHGTGPAALGEEVSVTIFASYLPVVLLMPQPIDHMALKTGDLN